MRPCMMIKTHYTKLCRGADGHGCSLGLDVSEDFADRIEEVVHDAGWPAFLEETFGDELNRHHGFQINVTSCPNGCSRPHIADIGLMRACAPVVDPDICTGCEACAEGCPDGAIVIQDGLPVVDRELCIDCGKCSLVCEFEAMNCARTGWRVLAGGRLGRHPQLATELNGWHSDDEALAILGRALKLFMEHYSPRKRFGRLMDEIGYGKLLERDE